MCRRGNGPVGVWSSRLGVNSLRCPVSGKNGQMILREGCCQVHRAVAAHPVGRTSTNCSSMICSSICCSPGCNHQVTTSFSCWA